MRRSRLEHTCDALSKQLRVVYTSNRSGLPSIPRLSQKFCRSAPSTMRWSQVRTNAFFERAWVDLRSHSGRRKFFLHLESRLRRIQYRSDVSTPYIPKDVIVNVPSVTSARRGPSRVWRLVQILLSRLFVVISPGHFSKSAQSVPLQARQRFQCLHAYTRGCWILKLSSSCEDASLKPLR